MRSFSLFRYALAFIFCWGSALTAHASHMMGCDLAYRYIGTASNPYLYHVTARLFQNNNLIINTTSMRLTCGRNECGTTLPGSFTFILTLTSDVLKSGGCPGSGSPPYRLTTLEGDVQLPPARWTLSIEGENRRNGIVNVPQSTQVNVYVATELDNSTGLTNSSPRFTTAQLIQLNSTQPQQRYSLNAFDVDGDSLVYQLIQPSGTASLSPCPTFVIGTVAPHFQLNPSTGELLTVAGPAQQGAYIVAARVDEYRRLNGSWQRIGSVLSDQLYFVLLSNNQLPAFTRVAHASNPTGQLLGQPIRVNPGQLLALRLTATDPDAGQALTLTSELPGTVPGVTFQDLGSGQAQLNWQVPASFPLGRYTLTATATDNSCPISGNVVVSLPILVTQQVLATRSRQPLAQLPHPMPFQDEVRFQLAGGSNQQVFITDEVGRTVAQLTTASDGSIVWRPSSTVPAGVYLARTVGGTQVARLAYSGR